jgi:hypothetical protein
MDVSLSNRFSSRLPNTGSSFYPNFSLVSFLRYYAAVWARKCGKIGGKK